MENGNRSSKRTRKELIAIIIVGCCSLLVQVGNVQLWTDNNQESKATVEAYKYAQSFSNIDRRLLFVHIPKTAGSTMKTYVAFGPDRNLAWGGCMFLDGTQGCSSVKDAKYRFGRPMETLPPYVYWHVPVVYYFNLDPNHAATFAVIRHPVDRAAGEYHCMIHIKASRMCVDRYIFY